MFLRVASSHKTSLNVAFYYLTTDRKKNSFFFFFYSFENLTFRFVSISFSRGERILYFASEKWKCIGDCNKLSSFKSNYYYFSFFYLRFFRVRNKAEVRSCFQSHELTDSHALLIIREDEIEFSRDKNYISFECKQSLSDRGTTQR